MKLLQWPRECEDGELARGRRRVLLSASVVVLAAIVAGCGDEQASKDRESVEPLSHDATNAARPEPVEPAASPAAAASDAPPIEVIPPALEMGPVVRDADAWSSVELRNRTDEPVVVRRVGSTCPCVVGLAENVTIPPAGVHELPVRYNAPFALGSQTKSLYVFIEGRAEPVRIDVSIVSVPGLALDPPALDPGAQERVRVALRSTDGKAFRIVRVLPPALPEIESLVHAPASTTFTFEWTRAAWQAAGEPASIILQTDREDDPRAFLQVSAAAAKSFRPAGSERRERDATGSGGEG